MLPFTFFTDSQDTLLHCLMSIITSQTPFYYSWRCEMHETAPVFHFLFFPEVVVSYPKNYYQFVFIDLTNEVLFYHHRRVCTDLLPFHYHTLFSDLVVTSTIFALKKDIFIYFKILLGRRPVTTSLTALFKVLFSLTNSYPPLSRLFFFLFIYSTYLLLFLLTSPSFKRHIRSCMYQWLFSAQVHFFSFFRHVTHHFLHIITLNRSDCCSRAPSIFPIIRSQIYTWIVPFCPDS